MMELISHEEFGRLRLRQFVPSTIINELAGWEYMNEEWVGEAAGFTAVLRLAREPDVVRSIELDLNDLPEDTANTMLTALKLPLRKGMTVEQITAFLGAPTKQLNFPSAGDRTTYEFGVGNRWRYEVACTLHEKEGLVFLSIMARRED